MIRFKHAIGIDIGGTKMAVALVNPRGSILERCVLPTEADQGFDRAVDRLGEAIARMLSDTEQGALAAIGIGCAGPLDSRAGLINNPYTLSGWNRCDIVTPLRQRFDVPVILENDADAAVAGEYFCGAAQEFDPVVMLTFGTGIGGASMVGGELYRGVNGEHPELGHIVADPAGPECYCGTKGCLESIASGTAIGLAGQRLGFSDARAVFDAAKADHPGARQIIDRAINAAGSAAWTICHSLLPQRLVLGGGIVDEHYELFATPILERLDAATQFSKGAVSVARAKLGNDAGIVGAACLALQHALDSDQADE